jgi:hypothetical protein
MRIWHLTNGVRLSPNSTEKLLLALMMRLPRNANFEVGLYLIVFYGGERGTRTLDLGIMSAEL